jgi:FHS family L-fucose permease-like MFS transporter
VPYVYGKVADHVGYQHAFFIPAACYVFIAIYGFAANLRKPQFPALPKEMV